MSRLRFAGWFAIVLLLVTGCTVPPTPTPTPTPKKVLLIASENPAMADMVIGKEIMELMLTKEVGVMVSMLEHAGYRVVVASPSGQPFKGKSTTLTPNLRLIDVKISDYAGVVVPCLEADFLAIMAARPFEAVELVKSAAAQNKPVAGQVAGVQVLAKAGVLKGKHFAQAACYEHAPDGIYEGVGVVRDGNIITSGICPFRSTYEA
jgi:putative intracellular protease/amidase